MCPILWDNELSFFKYYSPYRQNIYPQRSGISFPLGHRKLNCRNTLLKPFIVWLNSPFILPSEEPIDHIQKPITVSCN